MILLDASAVNVHENIETVIFHQMTSRQCGRPSPHGDFHSFQDRPLDPQRPLASQHADDDEAYD